MCTEDRLRWRSHQFLRFLVVGVGNTAFSYSVYALMIYVGLGYWWGSLISITSGILFSHRSNQRFVFGRKGGRGGLWRFALAWVAIYLVYVVLVDALITHGVDAYLAGFLALPAMVVASFLAQKYFVFVQSRSSILRGTKETP